MTQQLRALLIEDDPDQSAFYASLLEAAGFECDRQNTGAAAIVALSHERFDLVIVDWRLPGAVSENQLLSRLRSTRHGLSAKIIVMTALENESAQLAEAFRAGADDVYRKSMGDEILSGKFKSLAEKFAAEARVACRLEMLEESMVDHVATIDACSREKDAKIEAQMDAIANMCATLERIDAQTKQTAEIVAAWNQAKLMVSTVKTVAAAAYAVRYPVLLVGATGAALILWLKTGAFVFHWPAK